MPGTDYPDWEALPSLASILASGAVSGAPGGVPLLTFENTIYSFNGTIGANTAIVGSKVAVPQIAYNISVQLEEQVVGTAPWADIRFDWFDSGTNTLVQTDVFQSWIGSPVAAYQVFGRGPSKSNQLQVTIQNYDNQAITAIVTVITESRIYEADIWRTRKTNAVNSVFTLATARPESNLLAFQLISVAASGTQDLALPIWTGHAAIEFQSSSNTSDAQFFLHVMDTSVAPTVFNAWEIDTNAKGLAVGDFYMSRALYIARLVNNNAAAKNLSITITAIDR